VKVCEEKMNFLDVVVVAALIVVQVIVYKKLRVKYQLLWLIFLNCFHCLLYCTAYGKARHYLSEMSGKWNIQYYSRETSDENFVICNPKYKKPLELRCFV
jgi:hypothetical protein